MLGSAASDEKAGPDYNVTGKDIRMHGKSVSHFFKPAESVALHDFFLQWAPVYRSAHEKLEGQSLLNLRLYNIH